MSSPFRLHTITHLKFLARSRVLLGFAVLIVAGSGVGLIPALFLDTTSSRFDVLRQVSGVLHEMANIVTAGIGLAILWSHRRTRTIKMIATKPSGFDAWVASVFVSAALVGFAVHLAVATLTFALSRAWHVPYQIGFVYLAADGFAESLIVLALLTALSALMHPILAVLSLMFFNEFTFRYVGTAFAGASYGGNRSWLVRASDLAARGLYYVVPTFSPFGKEISAVEQSLRVSGSDWQYFMARCLYALLVCAFGYVMTIAVLRRRQLT